MNSQPVNMFRFSETLISLNLFSIPPFPYSENYMAGEGAKFVERGDDDHDDDGRGLTKCGRENRYLSVRRFVKRTHFLFDTQVFSYFH